MGRGLLRLIDGCAFLQGSGSSSFAGAFSFPAELRLEVLRLDELGTAPELEERELLLAATCGAVPLEEDDRAPLELEGSLLADEEDDGRLLLLLPEDKVEVDEGRLLLDDPLGREEDCSGSRELEDRGRELEPFEEEDDLRVEDRLLVDLLPSSGGGLLFISTTWATWFHSNTHLEAHWESLA